MSTPFIGEIEAFAFNFAPKGWALCNGQIMSIQQNQALFSLLGTQFGGNGVTTFALPNLQSRINNGWGAGNTVGEVSGELVHTLLLSETPQNTHPLNAAVTSGQASNTVAAGPTVVLASSYGYNPTGGGSTSTMNLYAADNAPNVAMSTQVIGPSNGGGQPHANTMPYLTVNYCIAISGLFPSRG